MLQKHRSIWLSEEYGLPRQRREFLFTSVLDSFDSILTALLKESSFCLSIRLDTLPNLRNLELTVPHRQLVQLLRNLVGQRLLDSRGFDIHDERGIHEG